ncbi:hypothetical protein LguiB_032250 [Lonicera macranthoides]
MPSRAFSTRKKLRPEVQYDELQQALLRVASQPSSQPSAAHPSAEQPSAQPSPEQPSAQPSHSPALPLVLPTLSTNSTTGSITDAGLLVPRPPLVTRRDESSPGRRRRRSSESYDIDPADKALITWIQKKAADRFKYWKYKIHKNWQAQGDAPIPMEFIHRPDQWQWLCNYFKAEDFQELGTQMTQIQASENKKAHTVQSARTAEVEKMMADLPPIDEALDGTSPASAPALVLSYETQVSVLKRVVGPSRGTRVRGLGSGSAKLQRKRGPSSQTDSDTSMELVAEVAQLRANQAAINEQLQREMAERERERVDFERKLQAQIEQYMILNGLLALLKPTIESVLAYYNREKYNSKMIKDHNFSVEFFQSLFLVQEWETPDRNGSTKETLRLDLVERQSDKYKTADVFVFNTGHWKGYYQEGSHIYDELNVFEAFQKAMTTWVRWNDANVDTKKTLVFFRGYSASHFRRLVYDTLGAPRCGTLVEANYEAPCGTTHAYSGHLAVMMLMWQIGIRLNTGTWYSRSDKSIKHCDVEFRWTCDNETKPIYDEQYLQMQDYIPMVEMVEGMLKRMKTSVYYLNVRRMSDFIKDAHPSIYRKQNLMDEERWMRIQDYSHWCLPGVPDTWNKIVYTQVSMRHIQRQKEQQHKFKEEQHKTP